MFVIKANTPQEAIAEVVDFFKRESGNLNARAALTTGRQRKDVEAQAAYASQMERFWRDIRIEPKASEPYEGHMQGSPGSGFSNGVID